MAKKKFPKLSHAEIIDEITKRTRQDRRLVVAIIGAYIDIIKDTLKAGITVPLFGIGTLTFRDYPPRPAGEYWDGFAKTHHYFPARRGHYKLMVKAAAEFERELKGATTYGDGCTEQEWNDYLDTYHAENKRAFKWRDANTVAEDNTDGRS